jgi:DNA mismatch endonuclease (patch repair protein)
MAGIRGKNTQPELLIRRHLHAQGLRFRLFRKDLPGRPDIVLPRWGVVVFAHGCFWHGHRGCTMFRMPKTRAEFWSDKISGNAERDAASTQKLLNAGWRVAIVWECSLRADAPTALLSLVTFIQGSERFLEINALPSQASIL